MHILLTTENCSECKKVENLIKKEGLKIKFGEADEETLEIFRAEGIRSFPVLVEVKGEKEGFEVLENGKKTGYYIVENLNKFR